MSIDGGNADITCTPPTLRALGGGGIVAANEPMDVNQPLVNGVAAPIGIANGWRVSNDSSDSAFNATVYVICAP